MNCATCGHRVRLVDPADESAPPAGFYPPDGRPTLMHDGASGFQRDTGHAPVVAATTPRPNVTASQLAQAAGCVPDNPCWPECQAAWQADLEEWDTIGEREQRRILELMVLELLPHDDATNQ